MPIREKPPRIRLRLFHWHEAEAAERVARLIKAGFDADFDHKIEPGFARRLSDRQPQALVIDLTRLPSHGREVALYARRTRATRMIPIVFAGGEPEKVARIRELIPEAVYAADWGALPSAIRQAVGAAPALTLASAKPPDPYMRRWAASPLAKKLGLLPGITAELSGAPDGFVDYLRPPEGVQFAANPTKTTGIAILFARTVDELDLRVDRILPRLGPRAWLWICWPKAGSKLCQPDLNQYVVLETLRAHGFVTSKIVAIDRNWSRLKFSKPPPY